MELCSVAELTKGASRILKSPEPYAVSNNGHLQSLVINVEGLSLDDVSSLSRQIARVYVDRLRRHAVESGLSNLSDEDIQSEINAARALA